MRGVLHEVTVLFQLRWMARVAGAVALSSLCLLLVLRKFFLPKLDPSFARAFQTLRTLEGLLLPAVGFSVLLFLLVVSTIVAIAVYFVSHRLAWPIFRAEHFAEALHHGDLRTPVFVRHGDQLRGLAAALEKLHGSLVAEVRQIGEALERIDGLWEELDDIPPDEYVRRAPEVISRIQRELDAAAAGRHQPVEEA
jgi:hypothetical protein